MRLINRRPTHTPIDRTLGLRVVRHGSCEIATNLNSQWRNDHHWHTIWPDGNHWCYRTAEEAADRAEDVRQLRLDADLCLLCGYDPRNCEHTTRTPIDRDEIKAVVMTCGPDPAPAEVADAVCAYIAKVGA